jgi:hypothetical protein
VKILGPVIDFVVILRRVAGVTGIADAIAAPFLVVFLGVINRDGQGEGEMIGQLDQFPDSLMPLRPARK